MNKRNKRLGTVVTLLFISAIAATSGTLAWFTTVRTASVTYGDAEVYMRDSDLMVTYKSSLNSLSATSEVDGITKITITGTNEVTDISGNGINFYKPRWNSDNTTASFINTVPSTNPGDADGYFIDFTLTLSRSAGEDPLNLYVFLGQNTALLPADPANQEDVRAVRALRMAVISYDNNDSDTGTPSVDILYAPETETNPQYLQLGSGGAYGLTTHELVPATVKSDAFETHYTIADSQAVYPEIAVLPIGTVSADVTFRVWIEGTDIHAVENIIGGKFKIKLDLYSTGI
ncbi:MAG: hypothetical protein BWX57_00512 [Tenericutes bacterium ADurb.Bin024]|nr:MAG: hypothetical protein BWX57_00512 [Tenericutes bacterium ADurb.Bin024]